MAAEASSPYFDNKGGNASVLDVADTYARRDEGQKRLSCAHRSYVHEGFVLVEGPFLTNAETSVWPSGATFRTRSPRFPTSRDGDQSGLVDVQVTVNLPGGQGSPNDSFVVLVIRPMEGRPLSG
jgi:hypothetical protein